jgi:ABC transporter with metal-binding/Fe-S-binding domain ATP-binding protein
MRVAVLFSGGKDSTFAACIAHRQGWQVRYLITMQPPSSESWMFHHPCTELTKLQAESIAGKIGGIKQILKKTAGEKEKELEDLVAALRPLVERNEIDAIVSGAVESRYQKDRVDATAKELGVQHIAPLWHKSPEQLLRQQLEDGFEIIITAVAAAGFDEFWLGRKIDAGTIEELKALHEEFGVHICGEGGEFESFVTDCPIFKRRIELTNVDKIWDEKTSSGYIICKDAKLVDK